MLGLHKYISLLENEQTEQLHVAALSSNIRCASTLMTIKAAHLPP